MIDYTVIPKCVTYVLALVLAGALAYVLARGGEGEEPK